MEGVLVKREGSTGPCFGRVGEPEFLDLAIEGDPVHTEGIGGSLSVMLICFERGVDARSFVAIPWSCVAAARGGLANDEARVANVFGKVPVGDGLFGGEGDDVVHGVDELAYVAGPSICFDHAHGVGRETHGASAGGDGPPGEQVGGEGGDVFGPITEGRQVDGYNAQSVVQVCAERAAGDGVFEVHVGGGDDADVRHARARFTDALERAFLQEAKELGLQRRVQVTDLIEEEGAAGGCLHGPDAVAHGSGEGASDVTEQLAFDEVEGERGAVDGDERFVASAADVVDSAGHELLARTALARDEHGGVATREASDGVDGPSDGGGASDDGAQGSGVIGVPGSRRAGEALCGGVFDLPQGFDDT